MLCLFGVYFPLFLLWFVFFCFRKTDTLYHVGANRGLPMFNEVSCQRPHVLLAPLFLRASLTLGFSKWGLFPRVCVLQLLSRSPPWRCSEPRWCGVACQGGRGACTRPSEPQPGSCVRLSPAASPPSPAALPVCLLP